MCWYVILSYSVCMYVYLTYKFYIMYVCSNPPKFSCWELAPELIWYTLPLKALWLLQDAAYVFAQLLESTISSESYFLL